MVIAQGCPIVALPGDSQTPRELQRSPMRQSLITEHGSPTPRIIVGGGTLVLHRTRVMNARGESESE
jgi:hypothetical protein